jgi:predicted transcriptional regulator
MKNNEIKLGYTTILHHPRIELGLTINEYCFVDMVYNLSSSPNAAILGWCYASKESLGKMLGVSSRTINTFIKNMIDKNLVEKQEYDSRYIRTTEYWYSSVVLFKHWNIVKKSSFS